MTTLTRTYSTRAAARRAVEALRGAGVPGRDIRLFVGRELGDVRRERVGGFAGPIAPDAPVGTYGDRQILRRRAAGGFAGDPDHQRQGSFGDSDRVVMLISERDAERARVTGLRGARRLLAGAALDDHTLDRALSELQIGNAVVLVDLREITASQADAQLERIARAA